MIYPSESDLKPILFRDAFDKIATDRKWQADEVVRCSDEPWYWLVNYVWTIRRDEHIQGATLERFPADEYLQYIFDQNFRESFLVVDKSRQMRMTWVMMAYYLWRAQYGSFEMITVQTKKERDADDELIERAFIMWKHQAPWIRAECKRTFCRLNFPLTNAIILGIPCGGDQIRSHNPSRHFIDECGFLEGEFNECKDAALACCKDVKLISSANPGQWREFVCDEMEHLVV